MFGLILSHTRKMAGLANAAGMAKLRDEALLEVELLGQQCPKTGDAVPGVLSGGQAAGYAAKQEIYLAGSKAIRPEQQPTNPSG